MFVGGGSSCAKFVWPVLSGSPPISVERFGVVHSIEAWQPKAALIVSACLRKSSNGIDAREASRGQAKTHHRCLSSSLPEWVS